MLKKKKKTHREKISSNKGQYNKQHGFEVTKNCILVLSLQIWK